MTKALPSHVRVAIIGAGPAGIYAGNILHKSVTDAGSSVTIDMFEHLPAPYGLIRYGVAPDHPRIKGIVNSLHEMLDSGIIRFFGNVHFGTDLTLDDIRSHYHAVIFATGAIEDATLNIPGVELDGSFGAADFVSWFDGHPDVPRTWPLTAKQIAVIGNGNVALDVARMLAKHPKDLLSTDIPQNVYEGLSSSPVTDVHVFGRRGPAHVKFTPIELRELAEVPDVDIVVYEDDYVFDDNAKELMKTNNQVKVMSRTLNSWLEKPSGTASRRLHLHFLHSPLEVYGESAVQGVRFKRTVPNGDGTVSESDEILDYPVQAVYRAVGYRGSEIPGIPFNEKLGVMRNVEGRVTGADETPVPGVYASGWIKRGPVGLIGHTKGDAMETVAHLVSDLTNLEEPTSPDTESLLSTLRSRGVQFTTWEGWLELDEHEKALGRADDSGTSRERVKVVDRLEQVNISNAGSSVFS